MRNIKVRDIRKRLEKRGGGSVGREKIMIPSKSFIEEKIQLSDSLGLAKTNLVKKSSHAYSAYSSSK
jgi:hypothetical protein